MAHLNSLHTGHLIDAAFLTRPRTTSRPDLRLATGHEQAMAHRLHQLQTALGENHGERPASRFAQVNPHLMPPRQFGMPSMVLTGLLSAVLGAGAMWFAMTGNLSHAESSPTMPAVQAPPLSVAASPAPTLSGLNAASPADQTQIEDLLETWLQAWRNHDIAAYLGTYGEHFTPADGSSHGSWVAARTKKLANPAAIDVQIRDVAMTRQAPDLFKVNLRQDYASGSYREAGRAKTLLISRVDGQWKIVREQQD